MTLQDLADIEDGIRQDDSGFSYTSIRGEEVLALIRIVRAVVAYTDKPGPGTGTELMNALREVGL
jgi:hypothetical protein